MSDEHLVLTGHLQASLASRLSRAIAVAYVDAMDGQRLAATFDTSFAAEYRIRRRYVSRFTELCAENTANRKFVRRAMMRIERDIPLLLAPKRKSADSTLGELCLLLSRREQIAVVARFLMSDRQSRRLTAYKLSRGIPHDWQGLLGASYRRFGDTRAFLTAVRCGADPREISDDVVASVSQLADRYHRALALEQLLVRDTRAALDVGTRFPMALSWAIGRQRRVELSDFVLSELDSRLGYVNELIASAALDGGSGFSRFMDCERDIGFLVWVLGKLGCRRQLDELAAQFGIA